MKAELGKLMDQKVINEFLLKMETLEPKMNENNKNKPQKITGNLEVKGEQSQKTENKCENKNDGKNLEENDEKPKDKYKVIAFVKYNQKLCKLIIK